MIDLKYGGGRRLCGYPGPPERGTGESLNKLCWSITGDKKKKKDKTEAVLLQAHPEKTGFSGKDNNARKNRSRQEKRKTKSEIHWPYKRRCGLSLQELSRNVEDRTVLTSLMCESLGVRADTMACATPKKFSQRY